MNITPIMTTRAVFYCLEKVKITHKDGTRLSKESYESLVNTIYALMEDERVNNTHAKATEAFARQVEQHKNDCRGWD